MGTRSLTVFYDDVWEGSDEEDKEIVVMYRQFDGYPDGHGVDLAEFLDGFKITNGLNREAKKTANGMGCLAGQTVAHFKTEAGGIYLHAAGTRNCWEEYIYEVRCPLVRNNQDPINPGGLVIKCSSTSETYGDDELFEGTPEEFLAWVKKDDDE